MTDYWQVTKTDIDQNATLIPDEDSREKKYQNALKQSWPGKDKS